jgi:hypothetical protein
VKEEEDEYVLPAHDLGEVKEEEEEDVERDHDHPHQSMGYYKNEPYWKGSCSYHRDPSLLLVAW